MFISKSLGRKMSEGAFRIDVYKYDGDGIGLYGEYIDKIFGRNNIDQNATYYVVWALFFCPIMRNVENKYDNSMASFCFLYKMSDDSDILDIEDISLYIRPSLAYDEYNRYRDRDVKFKDLVRLSKNNRVEYDKDSLKKFFGEKNVKIMISELKKLGLGPTITTESLRRFKGTFGNSILLFPIKHYADDWSSRWDD